MLILFLKMEEKPIKKGNNPKGQGPSKPKKEKTQEEKQAQREKQAEKKRLKKEQARLEEEAKKKKELSETPGGQDGDKEEDKKEDKKEEEKKKEQKKGNKGNKKKDEKKEDVKGENLNGESKEGNQGSKKEKAKNGIKDPKKKDEKKGNIENINKEQKDKKTIKFFGLTRFEERSEELRLSSDKNKDNDGTNFSISEIIKFLSTNVKYSKVNEEIISSIRNIFLCGSSKQTKNCLNLLSSIKIFIDNVEGDDIYTICDEVSSLFRNVNKIINEISERCSGLYNTCKYLQQIADLLSSYPKNATKELIKSKIQYFIDRRIKKIDINNTILKDLIQDGDTILLYGKSKLFRKIILNAQEKNIKFSLIFVDSPKRNQISREIKFLSKLDIPVKYTYIKGINNLMSEVTKVFIKGDSMLINGDLMARQGSSILALIAKTFNKSVYVFCPSFKFMDKIIISNNQKTIKNKELNCQEIIFDNNITPSNLIKTVICENGYIHASSIPVYIRELEKNDNDFIIS